MADRANALLTKAHRETLQAEGDDVEYARQYRQRIRQRTRNGTMDLGVLFEHMEARDIKQVFGPDVSHLDELEDAVEDVRSRLSGYEPSRDLRTHVSELQRLAEEYADDAHQPSQHESDGESRDWYHSQRELHDRQEDTLQAIQQRAGEILDVYGDRIATLEGARDEFEQLVESGDYDSEYQDLITTVIEELDRLQQRAAADQSDLKEAVDEITYQRRGTDSLSSDLVANLPTGRRTGNRSETGLWGALSELDDRIQADRGHSGFEQGLRDDVVSALAFYLRVSEVLDTSTEELIEDAIIRTYEHEYPEEVVGHALVDVATADRTTAAKQASKKLTAEGTRLSSTELRAVAETKPSLLSNMQRQRALTPEEFRDAVLADPSQLEDGLEIVDANPDAPGDSIVPDLVAKDSVGNLVLIELKRMASLEQRPETTVGHVRELITQYGGEDRVRAFIVVPDFELEGKDGEMSLHGILRPEGPIELKSVTVV